MTPIWRGSFCTAWHNMAQHGTVPMWYVPTAGLGLFDPVLLVLYVPLPLVWDSTVPPMGLDGVLPDIADIRLDGYHGCQPVGLV